MNDISRRNMFCFIGLGVACAASPVLAAVDAITFDEQPKFENDSKPWKATPSLMFETHGHQFYMRQDVHGDMWVKGPRDARWRKL